MLFLTVHSFDASFFMYNYIFCSCSSCPSSEMKVLVDMVGNLSPGCSGVQNNGIGGALWRVSDCPCFMHLNALSLVSG